MAQHHAERESGEAGRENIAMQQTIDARQIHDQDKRSIDTALHPQDVQGAITEHLKSLSDVNHQPTSESAQADRAYAQYKQDLVNKVFDASGNVQDKASTKDIAALYDLNNAEIAAVRERRHTIASTAEQVLTTASYDDRTAPLPHKLHS